MKDQVTALMEALNRSQYEIGRFRRGQQGLETTVSAVEKILADPVVAAALQGLEPFTAAPPLVPEPPVTPEETRTDFPAAPPLSSTKPRSTLP